MNNEEVLEATWNRRNLHHAVYRISFSPYTVDQMLKIIVQRLEAGKCGFAVFEAEALRCIAISVGQHCGDARKALQICRIALEEHIRCLDSKTQRFPKFMPDVPPLITMKDVSKILTRVLGGKEIASLKMLDEEHQLVLVAVYRTACNIEHCWVPCGLQIYMAEVKSSLCSFFIVSALG